MKMVNKKNNTLFSVFILLAAIFMGIGYASINSVIFHIDGSATAMEQDGIFITEVNLNNSVSADNVNNEINNIMNTSIGTIVTLDSDEPLSSITYDITVYNNTSAIYYFDDVIYDTEYYSNDNISFEVINLSKGTVINSKEFLTFQLKFFYLDGNNITNNTLDCYLNFNFVLKTWQSITNYGMSDFEITSSSDGAFVTINYTSVPSQFEKINLPLNNLTVGGLYQLTFTTHNDNTLITTDNAKNLVYGCTVMSSPLTDFSNSKKLIAYEGYNSGFLWKTLSTDAQSVTLTFRATAETMYWVWDLSLIEDQAGVLYIEDISIKESVTPVGAYIDVPNTSIYQKEIISTGSTETITIQKGTFITKADYDNLVVNIQTAAGYEFINIPIVNLTVGKTYTINFSNLTTNSVKSNLLYGAKVQANKQEGGGQLITSSDYNITNLSIVNSGSITFTATSSTMYWVWDCGGLTDQMWSKIDVSNISLS